MLKAKLLMVTLMLVMMVALLLDFFGSLGGVLRATLYAVQMPAPNTEQTNEVGNSTS